jgi:CheY-like chemotaxis protein
MDDQEIVCDIACAMLKELGYETVSAHDGNVAIGLYREASEAGNPFDLVIMDLTIPGGMGGKEAVRKLKEYDPEARVVVSSGYSNEAVLSNYLQYGFDGAIVKPYKLDKLSQVLGDIFKV